MSIQKVFVLFKPDCLKRGLVKLFLSELLSMGLSAENQQQLEIKQGAARFIYRDCLDKHFYQDLENFILSGPCMTLVVSGDDAINKVTEIKNLFRKENSASWIELTIEEIALWEENKHPRQKELNIKLTAENLVHSTDTEEEAEEVIEYIYSPHT